MITVIDYGMGNLKSMGNAFQFLREDVRFATNPTQIRSAKKIIFPGVGNFGTAMQILRKKNMDAAIEKAIQGGVPFLGICLGFQLLFEGSEETPRRRGLGIFKGKVFKFKNRRIPHMGWNQIALQKKSPLFLEIGDQSFVYFMHSFYVVPQEKGLVASTTEYGGDFCSAISSKNIFGVQFHPEKSGKTGLRILKNFIDLEC